MATAYVLNQIPTTYGQALSLLVEMLVSAGWTYQGSGDGVGTFAVASGPSGKVFTGTGSGALGWNNNRAWARIQDPSGTREFLFQHDAAGGARIKYSPSAKFVSSSLYTASAFAAPGATDERFLRGGHTSTTVTISIATPAVVTWAAHGLTANAPVVFTTTGALPAAITAGTTYYVSATGLLAGSFQISATPGGASISTAGNTQSGTHTGSSPSFGAAWFAPGVPTSNGVFYGTAKDTAPYGYWFAGSSNSTVTFTNASANVTWNAHGLAVGSLVTFSTSGTLPTGGFTPGVTYFVIAVAANTFTVAATLGGTAFIAGGTGTGTHTASAMRTSLVFDPVTSVAEDPDPYVLHIGSTSAFSMSTTNYGRDGGVTGGTATWASTNGGTVEGCFAVMDMSRVQFLYVQPAGYALSATGQTAANGFVVNQTGGAVNPFNTKNELLPFPYLRIQQLTTASPTTVSPGCKGWSTFARWTGTQKTTLIDTLDTKNWICIGPFWLPWDGTTTPIG